MINNPYQPQMMTYTPGYNAYPYNPMQRFQEQQLPQQPVQQVPQQQNLQMQTGINGRMVNKLRLMMYPWMEVSHFFLNRI